MERILERARGKRLVLVGESTHGTHEFYAERAELTKRLIAEHGFSFVAAEADWPDAYRVNRYVRGLSEDGDADDALRGFRRLPSWMWRNTVVAEFVEWLRGRGAGFYGIDLYSLHSSMEAVVEHLDRVDPEAARRRARAVRVLRPLRARAAGVRVRNRARGRGAVRGRGRRAARRAAAARGRRARR